MGAHVRVAKRSEGKASATQTSVARKAGTPGVVRVDGWEEFSWLAAGFSTRQGGFSTVYSGSDGPGEQNLGWTQEDDEAHVAANRKRFAKAVAGKSAMELVTIRQFHSGMIQVVGSDHGTLATENGRAVLRGDALITDVPGVLLGVQTADCVPVLIADRKKKAVAAFHAGWRGTVARIVERGVGTMRLQYGSKPKDLVAAIGPAIGSCCFAVGEEVRSTFESQFAYGAELAREVYDSDPSAKNPMPSLTARVPGHSNLVPRILLDLFEANRRQLLDAGLREKAITVVGECSACTRLKNGRCRYFSHRAEQGFTGRMMSVIGVRE